MINKLLNHLYLIKIIDKNILALKKIINLNKVKY